MTPPPPPPQPITTSFLVIILPLLVGAASLTFVLVALLRRDRRRLEQAEVAEQLAAKERRQARVNTAVSSLQQVRYCLNHAECQLRGQSGIACLVVQECCKQSADCCNEACPDKGRGMTGGCVICLADYADGDLLRVLPCRHVFHAACADRWLTNQDASVRTCPTCKAVALRVPDERDTVHRQRWRDRGRVAATTDFDAQQRRTSPPVEV